MAYNGKYEKTNQTKNQTIMRESGWYPPGAEFDPNAPYNQFEPEEKEYDIEAVFELRRNDAVLTTDYDGDGNLNNPRCEWSSLHMTPMELIAECKRLAVFAYELSCNGYIDGSEKQMDHLCHVIAECEGWENTYDEFNQV